VATNVPAGFFAPEAVAAAPQAARPASAPRIEVQEVETALPQPQVREEYRNSGQWRTDSPIAPPVASPAR
jgi:hypothetical protein